MTLLTKLTRTFAVVLALGFSTACTLSSDVPVTYVIITNTPPSAATDAPDANQSIPTAALGTEDFTPAPTLTPTLPTTDPEALFGLAEQAAHDGFYDDARRFYEPLLADYADAAEGYAQVALREGDFEAALAALTVWLTAHPDTADSAQAYFLRGEANLGVGRWTSAVNDYRQYLQLRPSTIDSYVHERIADAFFALGMTNDALSSYDAAVAANRARVPLTALRERAAQVYRTADQHQQAAAIYDAIIAESQNRAYRATIELAAADALREGGDTAGARVRYQRVFDTYIDVPAAALPAMAQLDEEGIAISDYQRGRAYYFAEDYQAAIQAFNEYTTSVALDQIPAELHLYLGRAYRAVGNTPAALVAFRTVVEQYPTSPLFGEAVLEQGRSYFLAGDVPEAIRTYLQIADTYRDNAATAAEALWRAGYLHNEEGEYAEAREVFITLAQRYPVSEQAVSGLNIAASAALATGDNGLAEQLFRGVAEASSGQARADASLQVGRLANARGAQDVARQAWTDAITASPDSFAAARSRDYLAGRRMFEPPTQTQFAPPDLTSDKAAAEAWVRQTFGVPSDAPIDTLPPAVTSDARWIRASELWELGLYEAGETEFIELLDAYRENGPVNFALMDEFLRMKAYYPSQQAAANLIAAADAGTLDAPAYIARRRYPVPYLPLVLDEAAARNIDPLLLLSLIRHESLFDTFATAAAGEKGLTQVIPSTGEYIAGLLDWPDYDHSDLFQPHAGIAFGATYLQEQLERFSGNPVAALSAYNAGPGRAIQWMEASGGDLDTLLDTISITSTRGYVQRIYTFYTVYRALYGV